MKSQIALVSILSVFSLACTAEEMNANQTESKIDTAIQLIKVACVSGESLAIDASADGGLSLGKKGASGSLTFSKVEINGVVRGANQSLTKEENSEIRKCMQQYVPMILETLLEKKHFNIPTDPFYYLSNQKIPVDIPISILDGSPTLVVNKIYENNRWKFVEVKIEIPHRNPYQFNITYQKNSYAIKDSGEFEYRDVIYKLTVEYINLQDQYATFSLIKYKEANKG